MDRRTFLKTAVLAPAAVSGLMADYTGGAASAVRQAYPVLYGPVIPAFGPAAEAYGIGAGCPVGFGNEEQEKARKANQNEG